MAGVTLQWQATAETDCQHTPTRFNCVKYIKNYDGDTITFDIPGVHELLGKKIGVRVRDIDTAELKTKNPCEKQVARISQKLVENLLKNAKRIDLANIGRDKYFRIDADVLIDGRNLKDILIQQNLAYSYDGGTKPKVDWCKVARQPARQR